MTLFYGCPVCGELYISKLVALKCEDDHNLLDKLTKIEYSVYNQTDDFGITYLGPTCQANGREIFIGSPDCRRCVHNKGIDEKNKTVSCEIPY